MWWDDCKCLHIKMQRPGVEDLRLSYCYTALVTESVTWLETWNCGTLGNPVGRKEAFHEWLLLGIFVLSNGVGTLEKIQALASARLGFEFQPCHLLEPWENDLTSWFFKIIVFGPTSSSWFRTHISSNYDCISWQEKVTLKGAGCSKNDKISSQSAVTELTAV